VRGGQGKSVAGRPLPFAQNKKNQIFFSLNKNLDILNC